MIRLTRSQVQPIGVDIGQDSIKMLQLEVAGRSLSVVAAARQAFPPELRNQGETRLSAAADMIRQMLRHNPFSGRRIVLSLPRELLHVRNLRLPLIPEAELVAALAFEARNVFPFDIEQAQVHHLATGEVRQGSDIKQEVILLAARSNEVNNLLETLHRSGGEVAAIDVEQCALYRSVERFIRRREDEQVVHVLVDVGWRRSQIVIGRGRDINFIKPLETGGQHLNEAVSQKLGIPVAEAQALRRRLAETAASDQQRDAVREAVLDATRSIMESLAREISLCLRYYSVTFRGHRPTGLTLLGGEAQDPHLRAVLNAVLPVPVHAGRPLYSVDTSRMKAIDRRGPMSEWALALGLGLRLCAGPFAPRDGKPRDPDAPRPDLGDVRAEIIDIAGVLAEESAGAPAEPSAAERSAGAAVGPLRSPQAKGPEASHG